MVYTRARTVSTLVLAHNEIKYCRIKGMNKAYKTWPATIKPNVAPLLKAWRALTGGPPFSSRPRSTTTRPLVTGSSISGMRIFEIAIEAGIDMTEDVTRFLQKIRSDWIFEQKGTYWGGTPSAMYAVRTDPDMVEKPEFQLKKTELWIKKRATHHLPWRGAFHSRCIGRRKDGRDTLIHLDRSMVMQQRQRLPHRKCS